MNEMNSINLSIIIYLLSIIISISIGFVIKFIVFFINKFHKNKLLENNEEEIALAILVSRKNNL